MQNFKRGVTMKSTGFDIDNCRRCRFGLLVEIESRYKRRTGRRRCTIYNTDIPDIAFNEKPGFCKVVRVTVEEEE